MVLNGAGKWNIVENVRAARTQMRLFADPQPLVERLGGDFFRQAPEGPGVYLMRDTAGVVLYVGKAKNLRQRLASYRVANPDQKPRRHLRLLRKVARIELQTCPNESSALARESALLRTLRPRFNRAGTWAGSPRLLAWRVTATGLHLAVATAVKPGWRCHRLHGAAAVCLRAALIRLMWCALHPQRGLMGMPAGWFHRRLSPMGTIPANKDASAGLESAAASLDALFCGRVDQFTAWIRASTIGQDHPFEAAVREADLETVIKTAGS